MKSAAFEKPRAAHPRQTPAASRWHLVFLAIAALSVVGCQKEEPAKLDLSKDNSDIAEKMSKGEPVPLKDVIPKDDK